MQPDETSTDFLDDISVPASTDLYYSFSIQPVDLTGCVSQFITSFGTFAGTIIVTMDGDQPVSQFLFQIPNASLPLAGFYTWKNLVTWPGGTSLLYGHGGLEIQS